MSTPFTLLPVTLTDGPVFVRTQNLGFADDVYRRASFPDVPLEVRMADSLARWPTNFVSPGAIYMKTVDRATEEIIGYSKLLADAALTDALKDAFGTNHVLEDFVPFPPKDPVGLNNELTEKMSGGVRAMREKVLNGRAYILLSLLCVLPEYRRKGVASQHLDWAVRVADEAKLPIWLDASPMSVELYKRYGFVAVGEVKSDLSCGTSREKGVYIHTCMLREPLEAKAKEIVES